MFSLILRDPICLEVAFVIFYRENKNREKIKKVMSYLESTGITTRDIGVPTSFINSGQQWDGR